MSNFADGCYSCKPTAALIAKVLAGECELHYTRAAVGKGHIPEGIDPSDMTAPADYVMDADIASVSSPVDGECHIIIQLKSEDVDNGFWTTGVLLYANDPDVGNVPYTYLVLENNPEWIRAFNEPIGKVTEFEIVSAVGEISSVKATIAPLAQGKAIQLSDQAKADLKTDCDNIEDALVEVEHNKVDKVNGKALSTNDFTNDYKNKLDSTVSVKPDQGLSDKEKANARTNIGAGTSSFSGSYNDLTNKPTIPSKTSQLTNDSKYLTAHQDISGKANLVSPVFTGTPVAPTAVKGTNTTQIATTAFVQTAIGDKQDKLSTQTAYSKKGNATTVPQITTNSLGQVTGVTDVAIVPTRTSAQIITVKTGSNAQQRISAETFINWLISQKIIPAGVSTHIVFSSTWNYAGNDILQFTDSAGIKRELQLAGCMFEFSGQINSYNNGVYRFRIYSSPATNFNVSSGYSKVPARSIAMYTCNEDGHNTYSPSWDIFCYPTANNIVGTLPISKGGTGKTTAKAAQNALLSNMNESTNAVTDTNQIVVKYADPNDTNGAVLYKKTSLFWDYIKGKSDSVYLGISATAAAATKLSSSAGSATNPVYFSGGKPTACTYSLNKTVPSDAKFTDTDTKVTQTVKGTGTGTKHPILLSAVSTSVTTDQTNTSYKCLAVYVQPSTGLLGATKFSGSGEGLTNLPTVKELYSSTDGAAKVTLSDTPSNYDHLVLTIKYDGFSTCHVIPGDQTNSRFTLALNPYPASGGTSSVQLCTVMSAIDNTNNTIALTTSTKRINASTSVSTTDWSVSLPIVKVVGIKKV